MPLGKLSNDDIGRNQPSLSIGIPYYSALNDPACKNFNSKWTANETKNTLAIFFENSSSYKYLIDRKKIGAGKL